MSMKGQPVVRDRPEDAQIWLVGGVGTWLKLEILSLYMHYSEGKVDRKSYLFLRILL